MLEWPVAFRASRGEASHHVLVDPCADIIEPPTIQTRHLSCRAVDLLDLPATGQMMKPVDILGDQASQHPLLLPSCQNFVSDIRLCIRKFPGSQTLLSPVLDPRLLASHKIVEQHRL